MFTLFSHKTAPNGWKVAIILEALNLKYETVYLDLQADEQKRPDFLKINPNGRIPALIDHDHDNFTIWESNAIINYLLNRYDKEYKLHFPQGTSESYLMDQWMTFQVSGQGPYFGQAAWFVLWHPEKLPSVLERYQKEALRIISVLDGVLADRDYLVGNKPSAADIVFFPWDSALNYVFGDSGLDSELANYKNFTRWHESIKNHPVMRKTWALREKVVADVDVPSAKK